MMTNLKSDFISIDVAILHVYLENVCGSLLDSIDYFLYCYESLKSKSVRLFLLNTNYCRNKFSTDGRQDHYQNYVKYIIEDRYGNSFSSSLNNIQSFKISNLSNYQIKNSIIVDNHTYPMVIPYNRNSHYVFVVENFLPTRTVYQSDFNHKTTILNESCFWEEKDG